MIKDKKFLHLFYTNHKDLDIYIPALITKKLNKEI